MAIKFPKVPFDEDRIVEIELESGGQAVIRPVRDFAVDEDKPDRTLKRTREGLGLLYQTRAHVEKLAHEQKQKIEYLEQGVKKVYAELFLKFRMEKRVVQTKVEKAKEEKNPRKPQMMSEKDIDSTIIGNDEYIETQDRVKRAREKSNDLMATLGQIEGLIYEAKMARDDTYALVLRERRHEVGETSADTYGEKPGSRFERAAATAKKRKGE